MAHHLKRLLIFLPLFFMFSCMEKKEDKKEVQRENQHIKENKTTKYVIIVYKFKFPVIYSENRFDNITINDIDWRIRTISSDIITIENYTEEIGYKLLDDFLNTAKTYMNNQDDYYKTIDLPKIDGQYDKRQAAMLKSKITNREIKTFDSFKKASEYRFKLVN